MGILNKINDNSLNYANKKAIIGIDGEITYSELWEKQLNLLFIFVP